MGVVKTGFAVLGIVATAAGPAAAQVSYARDDTTLSEAADAPSALDTHAMRAPLPRPRPKTSRLPGAATSAEPASPGLFGPAAPATSTAFATYVAPSSASPQSLTSAPPNLDATAPPPTDPGAAAAASAAAAARHPGIAALAAFPLPQLATAIYSTAGVPFPPSVIAAAATSARAETDPANVAAVAASTPPAPVTAGTTTPLADVPRPAPASLAPTDLTSSFSASAAATTGHGTRAPQAGGGQQLRISNNTNVKIATLSIIPTKGRVRPTRVAENLLPFKSTNAPLPLGQGCDFTVRGTFEDGSPLATGEVDLCRDPLINITLW
jgi:hypothetical protein